MKTMNEDYIDFAIQNDVAIEFIGDLLNHLKRTGHLLQINAGIGAVDMGVEDCICLSFMASPGDEYGQSMTIDKQE